YVNEIDLSELRCINDADHLAKEAKVIGSLGGGNHFIEIDKDDEGRLYLVIHSGSRHLGKEVAEYYQEEAYKQIRGLLKSDIEALIADYKATGKESEIESVLKEMKGKKTTLPKELAYCSGSLFEDYIHDMKIMQKFADLNRKAMVKEIIEGLDLHMEDSFTTIHNYIDMEHMVLRKGAVSARLNERLLIPINMRDGSLICVGKGNEEWNASAPHGAGRLFSRSEAMRKFAVEDFKKEMAGIYTTTATALTLDECPMAYKDMKDIVTNITPTADIVKVIKPVYNFKAED
ncbi:MAG: RtcB family protein, partial [Erysipelotrichaceae bacterium]|nr:RtcB family protein [Erysipelotrichaceae bacterium]